MEKKILFPIVLLQGNSVITARTVIVKFSLFQENIPEVCALKLGTIDECDQNLQTVPKRHIFQNPAFSWLLDK